MIYSKKNKQIDHHNLIGGLLDKSYFKVLMLQRKNLSIKPLRQRLYQQPYVTRQINQHRNLISQNVNFLIKYPIVSVVMIFMLGSDFSMLFNHFSDLQNILNHIFPKFCERNFIYPNYCNRMNMTKIKEQIIVIKRKQLIFLIQGISQDVAIIIERNFINDNFKHMQFFQINKIAVFFYCNFYESLWFV
ncbi:unnamed protein product (macronuclear) [Paramecium tetraurelia]|uniref:Transmembrane protein n=1 Tax=Paramecium tetraurelia TaxID=5888 RepID=A0D535_PARTE|nr:uncharacterized protein GSPATT00013599001 [Paramecium tetraurelia]CAK78152.1 unnamed protein product [Paramecium tetraurelia]|eukprot:XP_001445549.1 hypothetical protein (macronuclear) [Paramecium tetraurelia strain d4-2]